MSEDVQESDGFKEISASEILAKIEKGEPVEYENVVVNGDLDISNLKLPMKRVDRTNFERGYLELPDNLFVIKSTIKFENSKFEGPIKLRSAIFEQELGFQKCKFNKYIHFSGSQFSGSANFQGSLFNGFADFTGAHFNGGAFFLESIFYDRADFVGSYGHIIFVGTQFNGEALLFRSKFGTYTQFNGAKFGHVDFSESEFNDVTYFHKTRFSESANFFGSIFHGKVEFKGSEFKELVDFSNSHFMGYTNFDNCDFTKIANFGGVSFEANSSCSFRYSNFNKVLISWKDIKNKLIYDDYAYLTFVQNYNGLGWFDDADACYYQYRTQKRKRPIKRLNWILDIITWWFYGYGVRFYYPLAWLIVICVISAIVYILGGQAQFPGAFGLSIVILTTTTQINGLYGPLTGLCWITSMIERISGWLLMSSFLVALAKKILR